MTATATPPVFLPTLKSIQISDFSLYSLEPLVSQEFGSGAYCLAGANGLGKTTFLTIVAYALTGCVADPSKDFKSFEEYFEDCRRFCDRFFDGRISEQNRESAQVRLVFDIGGLTFDITRGFFEGSELRSLLVMKGSETVISGEDLSAEDRQRQYSCAIKDASKLSSFFQFVFLQLLVLTFDERRHLLFWNQRVLERALYLAFGGDPDDAASADTLKRDAERADSLARNAKWAATKLQQKIKDLKLVIGKGADAALDSRDLLEEHKKIEARLDASSKRLAKATSSLRDAQLEIHELSAKVSNLTKSYDLEFERVYDGVLSPEDHPMVRESLRLKKCGLCMNAGEQVAAAIKVAVSQPECPLCGGHVGNPRKPDLATLKAIDTDLNRTRKQLQTAHQKTARLGEALQIASDEEQTNSKDLKVFERANAEAIRRYRTASVAGSVEATIQLYAEQAQEHINKAKDLRAKRDEKLGEIKVIHRRISAGYRSLEQHFVPKFHRLAKTFIGLDLDVKLETLPEGLHLIVSVDESQRREQFQLSESQRFFIDIALRMALVQQMAGKMGGCLFIDTPEGSLDITYEHRAGELFGEFVKDGYQLLMTANINSSRLLTTLAEKASSKHMKVCRMTSWTRLSDVQQEREDLFDDVCDRIDEALAKNA